MTPLRAFSVISLYFSSLGVALSGYLSYQTLFVSTGCTQALLTCGENPVRIIGVPQCVLGFTMFLMVGIVGMIIFQTNRPRPFVNTQIIFGLAGTLFSGGLSFYELWIRQPAPFTMPACVYGFFLFLGILMTAVLARPLAKTT